MTSPLVIIDTGKNGVEQMIPLRTKLALYIAVPLAFQVGLSATFGGLLDRAERMILHEYSSKEAIANTTWINTATSNFILSWVASQLSSQKLYQEMNAEQEKRTPETIGKLKDQFKNNPEQLQRANDLSALALKTQKSLKVLDEKKALSGQQRVQELFDSDILTNFWVNGISLRRAILKAERDTLEADQEDSFAFRKGLRLAMYGGLAFAILLGASAALLFGSTIGKRIESLKQNAERLARDEPLTPQLGGNDEIALFDETFHSMAKALKEATLKERAIIENARDVICSLTAELCFASANKALDELLGAEQSDLIGKSVRDFVDQRDQNSIDSYFEKIRTDSSLPPLDLSLNKKDGQSVHTIWSVVWLDDFQTYFCVVHDVTTRKNLEKMRQEIVNMVTHDIRSPLTTVQGLIQFLEAGHLGELNERGRRMVKNADLSADRIMALINDFLDTERLESGNFPMVFDNFKASSMIDDSLASVAGLAERKKVVLESLPTDLLVTCDRDRIVQILVNLIANAVKFSNENQTVTVSAQETGQWALFRVQDRGRGIPSDQTHRVFEKFKQVSTADARNMGGTGLGLSICKSIVEQHGGQIGVDSVVAEGSTFWFKLPLQSNES